METYPVIEQLTSFIKENQITSVIETKRDLLESMIPVSAQINTIHFVVYVADEYDDLTIDSEQLRVVLILRELEAINDASDYLDWCKTQALDANNHLLRSYFQETTKLCEKLRDYFPNQQLHSFIADLDFQLNAGAMQLLRKKFPSGH